MNGKKNKNWATSSRASFIKEEGSTTNGTIAMPAQYNIKGGYCYETNYC